MAKFYYCFALLLALSACRDQDSITYPQTFEVQNVRLDDLRFYRKATATRFDSVASNRQVQMLFEQNKDFNRKDIEASLQAVQQIVLQSETQAKYVYVDPQEPGKPKEEVAFTYKIENDMLKIEGDSSDLKEWANLFHYDKEAKTLWYFGRMSAMSYYDQLYQRRMSYQRWDFEITEHNNYARYLREMTGKPYVQKVLGVGDTLVIAALKVTYQSR